MKTFTVILITAGVLVGAVLLGLLLGGAFVALHSPEVAQGIAQQEQAKAAALRAEADTKAAAAAEAWAHANAATLAVPQMAEGLRVVSLGLAWVAVLVAFGLGLAFVRWANVRALVVYPHEGQAPVIVQEGLRGGLRVIDTARALGHVTLVSPGGEVATLAATEATALTLATQAQAAGVLIGVANKGTAEELQAKVAQRSKAMPLPVPTFGPTFASEHPAAGIQPGGEGEGLRLVYVKTPGMGNSKAARELADLREFITTAWRRSAFGRRDWVGTSFAGSGNKCTRGYYESIMAKLAEAGTVAKSGEGWGPVVDLAEALDAFGLAHEAEGLTGEVVGAEE